jgi:hypothetical protein
MLEILKNAVETCQERQTQLADLRATLTFRMTQKMRKNGKNGPSQRYTVSMTKPKPDIVIQLPIQ